MKFLTAILAAVALFAASVSQTSCTTTGPKPDSTALIYVSVSYATAKTVQKRPALTDELAAVATGLEALAGGVLNLETVSALLSGKLPLGDPEVKALAALISAYFPSGDAALPVNEKLAAIARTVAAAIRFGLPATK